MLPALRGPASWAVILCRFNDVPPLDIPRSRFFDFVSEYGRGGLFDYWRDVSNGTIDLSGSEVFGWYTMNYSFIRDGADPFKDGKTKGRAAWVAEARRLANENGIDLSRFWGVIALVNASVDDSNDGDHDMALAIGGAWGQTNWRWCQKCQGLVYGGSASPGPCPAYGSHDLTSSRNYALALDDASFPGQNNWGWCQKCQGLAYGGSGSPGSCPAGGQHDLSASGNYSLGEGTVGYPGQDNWRWCKKCQVLAFAGNASCGACAGHGTHDFSDSGDYTLVLVDSHLNTTFAAHETGHGYGLDHSWSANPDVEYGDQWDIMSAMGVLSFDNREYPPAGPGLNAPTLQKLGWLQDDRIFTYRAASAGGLPDSASVKLVPLGRPERDGYLMARVLTPNHVYTVEFRQSAGWDRGIGRDRVLIHELRSNYTTGQNNWRWCKKCQGLTYAGAAICPAGGVHDHSTSANYHLAMNDPGFTGQHDWRWCRKCQNLAYAGGDPGACPAGASHDFSASADYGLAINNPGFSGQSGWKWCNKCQALAYAESATPGACPAGGVHDHSGSANYTVSHDDPSAGCQDQWKWCSKCQTLSYDGLGVCHAGGSHDSSASWDYSLELNDPSFPGQSGWKWCSKCQGLAYAGGPDPGQCPAGGVHDHTGSGDYSLLHDAGSADGQNQWGWCRKCQLLAYAGNADPGSCPAGGTHDHTGSFDYVLSNFGQDRTFLITGDWEAGGVFNDSARNVRISVDSIDDRRAIAAVTLGFPTRLSPGPHPARPGPAF